MATDVPLACEFVGNIEITESHLANSDSSALLPLLVFPALSERQVKQHGVIDFFFVQSVWFRLSKVKITQTTQILKAVIAFCFSLLLNIC